MYGVCTGKCLPQSDNKKQNYHDERGTLKHTTLIQLPQIPYETRNWQSETESASQGKRFDTRVHEDCKCGCDHERRKRRAETKRKKMIQKLKLEYKINTDDLNNRIVDNMIMKIELIEKQKKLREKEKIKCRLNFINKLLQEEKCKHKGLKTLPDIRKKHEFGLTVAQSYFLEDIPSSSKKEPFALSLISANLTDAQARINEDRIPEGKIAISHEGKPDKMELALFKKEYNLQTKNDKCLSSAPVSDTDIQKNFKILTEQRRRKYISKSAEFEETHLKCYPRSIKFENCESYKTYVQNFRITNIGCEIIHCRYVGIEMKGHEKKYVPLRVEVTDNALLRPGLSFTSKITMLPTEEIQELNLFILYETRRKKNPNIHGYFRIPLKTIPARSIVHVSPTIIRFPSISWCVATDRKRSKYLTKSIKIKNTGAKICSCCIKKEIWKPPVIGGEKSENIKKDSEERPLEEWSSIFSYVTENQERQREATCLPEGTEKVQALIIELIDNVFDIFRFSRKYFIPLPPFSTVKIDVEFYPRYKGYHHERMVVQFEGAQNCVEKKIELMGDIKKIPLHIEPSTIDLKICILNSGVYEGKFKVHNDSKASSSIFLKVPGSMKKHALVFPRNPVIQPWSYQTCSVRLFPGITLVKDAHKYYKEDTKILEFPVFIQPAGANFCKSDHVKLHVFAILTDYTLELKPKEINFSFVTTLETVRTEISLTNHSLVVQEYGFLNLPIGVRIEPNNGFGFILPKETIPLYVLYSPVVDSKINNASQENDFRFQIQVTTISELGGFRENVKIPEDAFYKNNSDEEELCNMDEEHLMLKGLKVNSVAKDEKENVSQESHIHPAEEFTLSEDEHNRIRDYLSHDTMSHVSFVSENVDSFSSEKNTESHIASEKENFFDIFNVKLQDELSETPIENSNMNIITCRALIIYPKCELSSTVIFLPATPMSSICTTRFHLIGLKSNVTGVCRRHHMEEVVRKGNVDMKDYLQFEGCFEFMSKSSLITIEPCTGVLNAGQSIPIDIIFHPDLAENELQFLKVKKMQEEEAQFKEESLSAVKKSKMKMKLSKPLKHQKNEEQAGDINLANYDVNKYDLFSERRMFQQMIDPFDLIINVDCFIKTLSYPDMTERMEAHTLVLIAPVIKPSFIYLGNCQEINFGKVVYGDKKRKILEIQNIALKRISPRISALNPHGSFYCAMGSKMDVIDPEHIWRQPLTFAPMEERGKETEYFEIRHDRTILPLTVTGESISPKCTFSPDFALCLLESTNESESETEFSIESSCEAEMRIQFVIDSMKVSTIFRDDSLAKEGNGNSRFNPLKKHEKRTSLIDRDTKKCIKFAAEVAPEIAFQLENEFKSIADFPTGLFSIIGLNASEELVLDPFSRISMKIKFSPQTVYTPSANGDNDTSYTYGAYAARYKVFLFDRILLREMIVIGKINSKKQ